MLELKVAQLVRKVVQKVDSAVFSDPTWHKKSQNILATFVGKFAVKIFYLVTQNSPI